MTIWAVHAATHETHSKFKLSRRYLDIPQPPKRQEDKASLEHAAWMLDEIIRDPGDMMYGKANRFLGWAQAILYVHGIVTHEELRAINARAFK